MKKDGAKKFAIGAMIAAAAGYIAGILTAPKSGKETRKDIANATIKAKTEAEKKLKELHSELDKLMKQAKTGAQKLSENTKEEFATVMTKAQFAKEKARQVLSAVHEGDAEDKDLKKAVDEARQAANHLRQFLTKHGSQKAR